MRRSFGIDVLHCARCGGRMKLLAVILVAAVVRRILEHLDLPADPPLVTAARAPPEPVLEGNLYDEYS